MAGMRVVVSVVLVLATTSRLNSQETPEFPKPTQEHQWLHQFVGEWTSTSEAPAAPGQPAMTCQGKQTGRMLGGFWLVSESETDMMGTKIHAVQTIGYDPAKKKYVGTWVDSMFNYLWRTEGTVDERGKILTLEAEGPNFMAAGKLTMFRDVYEFKSKDHIVATSSMLGDDGKWIQFMTGNIRRKR